MPDTIDHYKFRPTRQQPVHEHVRLNGQFDQEQWWPAELRSLEFLGSPTKKWHEGAEPEIFHQELHLTAYHIDTPPQPLRTVRVDNQFTSPQGQVWQIATPELLLVPARKLHYGDDVENPEPPPGEHYACYRVEQAPEVNVPVRLQDQFDREPHRALVRRPLFLGVPVRKKHGDNEPAPHWNEKVHLVLYEIESGVTILDQFGSQPINFGAAMLGVPSSKQWLH